MADPSPTGWCPFATRVDTTKFFSGNQGVRAVCLHIAEGSYDAAVSWLSNAQTNPSSSAHFVVAKDGRISQLVSINDGAWANGLIWTGDHWQNPRGVDVNPSWQDLISGINPNRYTISVEHEGFYGEQWTPEMYAANNRLLAWIAEQLGQTFQYTPHRTLIGHYEIDPVDRANCPGPNVNYAQIAADANTPTLLDQVVPQARSVHIFGTTPLVSLPSGTVVAQLRDLDAQVYGYLDYQGKHWFISQYSFQNQLANFFDSAATTPPVPLIPALALNPGFRDNVTPPADELKALGAQWVRVLIFNQFQNLQTGQNTELDWLLERYKNLGTQVLVLVNSETLNEVPPLHSGDWNGYAARFSDLAQKVASFYRGKIGAIQILNEPDVYGILPEDYAIVLRASYDKIKAVSPVLVISAGICCGTNYDYISRIAKAAPNAYDGAGWHNYAIRVDGFPAPDWGFGEMREGLNTARGLAGKPLWITEIGAQLDYDWRGLNPPDAAAEYLTRAYALMTSLGSNTVAQAFWFTWKMSNATWGLVDDAGNRRPAWFAFQQAAHPTPTGDVTITNVTLSPTTLNAGQMLNVSITVQNNSAVTLATQGPDPEFFYQEGESFLSHGFPEVHDAYRVGIDFDGRSGVDHPYRWGFGSPLAPGMTRTITGAIRLNTTQARNYWAGLVREQVAWLQDRQGFETITVNPGPPPGATPTIIAVAFSPTTLDAGQLLNVSITVRNDSSVTLPTQQPNPGLAYVEGESFLSKGFPEVRDAYRVGVDFDGRAGIDHPYRWGLGAPLAAGQTTTVSGTIRVNNPQSKNYWAGLVREQVAWVQPQQGVTRITVNAPQPTGQPVITAVTIAPTTMAQGQLLQVSVTIRNDSNAALLTQEPAPGFTYNEGDNFLTKGNPPVSGAYRIGVDYDGRANVDRTDHPYRWGLGASLAPGQSVTVNGFIRLNRRQNVNYWVALIREDGTMLQDNVGTTMINVMRP